jgi:hypothetical protein
MSEENGDIGNIPSNLISEFFSTIIGRMVAGSIFVLLYFDYELPTENTLPVTLIFLCVAWVVGAAIDLASDAIFFSIFKILKWIFTRQRSPNHDEIVALAYRLWEQAGRPPSKDVEFWLRAEQFVLKNHNEPNKNCWEKRKLFSRPFILDPRHPFQGEKLETATSRRCMWFNGDKVVFRCMGVICLLVWFFKPQHWPFPDSHVAWWPSIDLWFWPELFWRRVLALVGILICVTCWVRMQIALNEEEYRYFWAILLQGDDKLGQ